jgi:hypothetical protein
MIHLTSSTEPGRIYDVAMDLMTAGTECGDTIGFIDWSVVVALTWRLSNGT